MPRYHPVFVDLAGRAVLIVGGGDVCLEKLNALSATEARITVLAPSLKPAVAQWVAEGRVTWLTKWFEPRDCEPYFMIIAATDDPAVNAEVFRAGNALQRLTNSVDDPVHCNFIMAAIAAEGPLQVAVSTSGCSPALAQRIRAQIAREIVTPAHGRLCQYLGEWRPRVKSELPNYRARQGFWERVLGSEVPKWLEEDRSLADSGMESGLAWARRRPECVTCGVRGHGFVTVCADCPHQEVD